MPPEPRGSLEYKTDHDLLIELRTEMRGLRADFKDAKTNYVTQAEFGPVKMLIYGCVGIMLSTVVLAVVYSVVQP